MSNKSIADYYSALDRLVKGRSRIIPRGTKITKDAVALEAGRGKGSIKKSRQAFSNLIADIEKAAAVQSSQKNIEKERLNRAKTKISQLRQQYEASLAREISLINELYSVKKKLAQLSGEKVLPLRGTIPDNRNSDAPTD